MIKEITMYRAVCDECGRLYEEGTEGEIVAWTDAESALHVALESEWRQSDGFLICPRCVPAIFGAEAMKPQEEKAWAESTALSYCNVCGGAQTKHVIYGTAICGCRVRIVPEEG